MDKRLLTIGFYTSIVLLIGVILSGPLTVFVVSQSHPQPINWQGIVEYAKAFHSSQLLTYQFGFLILIGSIVLFTVIHSIAEARQQFYTRLGLVFCTIFVAQISLNYMLQLAVLGPSIKIGNLTAMEYYAFNNPISITMALEMLGYGFLGLATWVIIPFFKTTGLGKWIRWLSVANGVISVLGAVLQAMTMMYGPFGFGSYLFWNLVFLLLCVCYVIYFFQLRKEVGFFTPSPS